MRVHLFQDAEGQTGPFLEELRKQMEHERVQFIQEIIDSLNSSAYVDEFLINKKKPLIHIYFDEVSHLAMKCTHASAFDWFILKLPVVVFLSTVRT